MNTVIILVPERHPLYAGPTDRVSICTVETIDIRVNFEDLSPAYNPVKNWGS